MPTPVNASTSTYLKNEDDILANGNDGTAIGKATRNVSINPDIGNAQTIVAVDGNLSSITVGTTDPLANTSGAASAKWSIAALMRWLIAEVRRITTTTLVIRQTANTSTTAITPTRGIKTVASAGTPEALVGASTLVQKVLIMPQKAARTTNVSVVYVDFVSGDDVQAIALSIDSAIALASASIAFEAPAGKKIDLSTIFIDVVTNGDGVYFLGID